MILVLVLFSLSYFSAHNVDRFYVGHENGIIINEQYYYRTNKKFPVREFHDFKIGRSKMDVIKIFGETNSDHAPTTSSLGSIWYLTDDGSWDGWMNSRPWWFEYNEKGIVVEKHIGAPAH